MAVGAVSINKYLDILPYAPFGGINNSGANSRNCMIKIAN
jgi:acyl-CoA reductase-like NAD-dependent aldehyde dehydrogenase